jgi:hypothetical protein
MFQGFEGFPPSLLMDPLKPPLTTIGFWINCDSRKIERSYQTNHYSDVSNWHLHHQSDTSHSILLSVSRTEYKMLLLEGETAMAILPN